MSRSWTREELQAASNYMKQHGTMGYEEFCAALAAGIFDEESEKPKAEIDPSDAMLALAYSGVKAEVNGTAEMTLDEINAEINAVRNERMDRKSASIEGENPAITAMKQLQNAMEGEAEKAGLRTEEDINRLVGSIRHEE